MTRPVEFLGGMDGPGRLPAATGQPQVAVAGPSNVGKSSLINAIAGMRTARVSKSPGRTQQLNYFRFPEGLVLVDLPGYGFAQVAKARRAAWKPLVEGYLKRNPDLKLVLVLHDIRRDVSDADRDLTEFLDHIHTPWLVVLTKADEVSRGDRPRRLAALAAQWAITPDALIPFSVRERKDEYRRELRDCLGLDPLG